MNNPFDITNKIISALRSDDEVEEDVREAMKNRTQSSEAWLDENRNWLD